MTIKTKWNGASDASKDRNLDPEEYSSTRYVVYDFRIVEKRTYIQNGRQSSKRPEILGKPNSRQFFFFGGEGGGGAVTHVHIIVAGE